MTELVAMLLCLARLETTLPKVWSFRLVSGSSLAFMADAMVSH